VRSRLRRLHNFRDIDEPDGDRFVRTGLHARGRFPDGQSIRAHVTFPHDPESMRILRHIIGTLHRAVLAAYALVIQVPHDTCFAILVVGKHRATFETCGFEAMVACGGHRLKVRLSGLHAGDQSNVAPGFILLESVQGMTRADASLAAGAGIEVDRERTLLAAAWLGSGDQITIVASLRRKTRPLMFLCEALDGCEPLLLNEQLIDKINLERDAAHSWKSTCKELRSCRVVND
jgi:hypothetical protein